MDSSIIRKQFLDFFAKRGHTIVPSSSLLSSDPTVLLTTAGMQQFKEYYLDKPSPLGNRVASCQKCFRTSDIDEVGDDFHLTFFEMLGNFSFRDYFKEEAIESAHELLVKDYELPAVNLWVTYFRGDGNIPEDKESQEIWHKLGVPRERISGFSREDNFWGPTGEEGPCGPTTEIHFDITQKPCQKRKSCRPNCDCGRFLEVWNLVFNEYYQDREKKFTSLKTKGVDTGMGLERLAVVLQKKSSVFEINLFEPIIREIEENTSKSYNSNQRAYRIVADHIKGAVFLSSEGVIPSNIEEGYILRRVLRKTIRFGKLLNLPENFLISLAKKVISIYGDTYPGIKSSQADILTIIQNEEEKFDRTLEKGLKEFDKLIETTQIKNKKIIPGEKAFWLFETYGFPLELTEELAKGKNLKVDQKSFREAFEKHQEISRAGAEKKFGGVGKKATYEATKLHTATHLLHQALREILGKHVKQMGSDITSQRLRFDFSHSSKMTEKEKKKVEDLINQKIQENLDVRQEEVEYQQAIESGALAFFKEKYPERVTIYSIGDSSDPSGRVFSKEICAGPHISQTQELGKFKIIKEESAGAGVRRIRAIIGDEAL
ncbi:MAG TPA: alanine--tRNA ligase [Candidatus Nealsonbacteria bacterium]|uniref:alanine--tRNA ligase n=1 Tax=marine sediment metagenome TaxID=412755 RepID=A0A0F9XTZ2_9ZZZZ|nr:alanine--tRNA ligase [Candidatus Nealsonbacteria bacterium]HEB46335.1 alanine--tRNA ligase [Candidatus Nealsonbacteria bacterium]